MAENILADTVKIGFGKSASDGFNKIKGYTYYYIKSGPVRNELIQENTLLAYPSPADDILTVEVPNPNGEKAAITLTNLSGQLAYRTETYEAIHRVDVQSLKRGIYILQVVVGNEKYAAKVIKK
jgi:hypothetical protein